MATRYIGVGFAEFSNISWLPSEPMCELIDELIQDEQIAVSIGLLLKWKYTTYFFPFTSLSTLHKTFAIDDSFNFSNYICCFPSKLCRHRTCKFKNLTF